MAYFDFQPHPLGFPIRIAKRDGYSVIHGVSINGYEIMDRNGNVRSGFTLEQAEAFVRNRETVNG